MESLLQVQNLTVRYRSELPGSCAAIDGISFRIAPGEVLGLAGESGCGKTSIALALLGLLSGEIAYVGGSISLRGRELAGVAEKELEKIRGREISLVLQEPGISLSPMMRAGDQVAEVAHAHRGWNWSRCRAEAEAMLARTGLSDTKRILGAYPHQLSGGQRQRVVLAQALIGGPALLIADEPTASLDARSQAEFIALLGDLKDEMKLAILLISHAPEILASLADRLIVMRQGRIVEEGSFAQLYRNSGNEYTRGILRRGVSGCRSAEPSYHPTSREQRVP